MFVNQAGTDADDSLGGCSMIVDPEGHVIARCEKTSEDLCIAELSARRYYNVRRLSHDYLVHRRPELYGDLARTDVAEDRAGR